MHGPRRALHGCVGALVWTINPLFAAAVFVPHWIIDRWSLACHWLKLIGGRTFESAVANEGPASEFDIAFTAIVYTVTDNTMHALCLLGAVALLIK